MSPSPTRVVLLAAMSPVEARQVVGRVERLLRAGHAVVCDVAGDDLAVVDALARVGLAAQRLGACGRLRVTGLGRVADLVELAGLGPALGQVLGEPEAREQ